MSNRANSGSQRPSRAAEKTRGTSAWKAAAGGAARPGARTRGPGAAGRRRGRAVVLLPHWPGVGRGKWGTGRKQRHWPEEHSKLKFKSEPGNLQRRCRSSRGSRESPRGSPRRLPRRREVAQDKRPAAARRPPPPRPSALHVPCTAGQASATLTAWSSRRAAALGRSCLWRRWWWSSRRWAPPSRSTKRRTASSPATAPCSSRPCLPSPVPHSQPGPCSGHGPVPCDPRRLRCARYGGARRRRPAFFPVLRARAQPPPGTHPPDDGTAPKGRRWAARGPAPPLPTNQRRTGEGRGFSTDGPPAFLLPVLVPVDSPTVLSRSLRHVLGVCGFLLASVSLNCT